MKRIRAIDLFCGAGGSSWGAQKAGVKIVAGFDMWDIAGDTYKSNFPDARVYKGKLESLHMQSLRTELGDIDLILASPECTNHSPAKGGGPRSEASKETAFQVTRFARAFSPRWVVIENVVSMRNWTRYGEFLEKLRKLGYQTREQVLNSKEFGVAQGRRRLFIICDREDTPPTVSTNTTTTKYALSIVNMNGKYRYSPLRTERRAKATVARADRAITALGQKEPFLIVYYGSDHAGGWQRLDAPLRTITTLDRFALVKPTRDGHEMRMLQPDELRKAMGMPQTFVKNHGTRRDKIRLIGNAVCPPVMRAVIRTLTKRRSER